MKAAKPRSWVASREWARMFGLKEMPANLDATDGLAVAVCHFYQKDRPVRGSGPKNWEDFIRKNPGRVR